MGRSRRRVHSAPLLHLSNQGQLPECSGLHSASGDPYWGSERERSGGKPQCTRGRRPPSGTLLESGRLQWMQPSETAHERQRRQDLYDPRIGEPGGGEVNIPATLWGERGISSLEVSEEKNSKRKGQGQKKMGKTQQKEKESQEDNQRQ
ncbi:hypothetical protein NDU88_006695 [Pleurodeles waltl]|uniref:Uncharacterized protein n=1 Tax=Pleurodeles waltl TaxID=8319 RepID=A0AAV7WYB5_PLEWA|nr:hypothetical protein NDU88_006695 [Pleurodeles waltl]